MKLLLILIAVFSLSTSFGQMNNEQKEKYLNSLLNDTTLEGSIKSIKQVVLDRMKKWEPAITYTVIYNKDGDWKEVHVLEEEEYLFKRRKFNNDGFTQSVTTFTKDGDTALYTTYEYDSHGITKEYTRDFINDDYEGYGYGYKYKYQDDKLIEKRVFFTANGRESRTKESTTYSYDENGKLQEKIEEGINNVKTTYSGDTLIRIHQVKKQKIKLQHLDKNGRLYKETHIKEKIEREYDDEGYIINESEPVEEVYSTETYTYNDHGDLIKKETKSKSMNLVNTMEITYDDKGNIIGFDQYTARDDENPIKVFSWTREIKY